LQCPDAFAFQKTLSGAGEDRFGSKTVLDSEGILHDPSQAFLLGFCHAAKITNESPNRKLNKLGARLSGSSTFDSLKPTVFRALFCNPGCCGWDTRAPDETTTARVFSPRRWLIFERFYTS
jgi:hypothetical protein